MATYLVRRLLLAASVVFAVSFAGFVGFGLSLDPSFPLAFQPKERAVVQAYYHLTDPILSRYWRWLTGFFHHGFGATVSTQVSGSPPRIDPSFGQAIGPQLIRAAEVSAALIGLSLVFVAVGSVAVGVIGAQRRQWRIDLGTRTAAYFGAAVPTFLLADLFVRIITPNTKAVFSHGVFTLTAHVGWFVLGPPTGNVIDWLRHLFLPAIILAVGLTGIYARYVRSAMTVELGKPYITVARAKGLPESRVLLRHALRNSLVPVTALLSLDIGAVVGASIAVDGIFGTGGLASIFLGALGHADPFQLTAIVVVSAVLVCGFTFAGDILVSLLDPRIRTS